MSQVMFFTGTQAQYDGLKSKDASALYFLTDSKRLYLGDVPFSHPVRLVDGFPVSGESGTLYLNTGTGESRTWDGQQWTTVSLPAVTSIGEGAADGEIATAKAVKMYVDGQIAGVASGVSGAVANVTYADKTLSVQKGTDSPVNTALSGLVDGASYDGETGILSFTTNGGKPISVNLPVENFLSTASFDSSSNVLTLTLTNGETVTVNLADLVDAYTGGEGETADVRVSEGMVTATVNVSPDGGNLLSARKNGLFATVEWRSLS